MVKAFINTGSFVLPAIFNRKDAKVPIARDKRGGRKGFYFLCLL
jgi:hypothetical protein